MTTAAPKGVRPGGRLSGKVAVVTGSTRGIGRTIAEVFAAEGASVVVSGRSGQKGRRTVERIVAAGGTAHFVECDVGDEEAVRQAMTRAVERYGSMTVLVNNTSPLELIAEHLAPVGELPTAAWEEIIRVGLTGSFFWTTKYAVPHMVAAGGGSVVNVSSAAANRGIPGYAAYTAVKAAAHGLTLTTAVDYGDLGIRANVLLLGRIEIPGYADRTTQDGAAAVLTPHLGRPTDAAWAATWLASDESRYVTGATIPVDGGYSAHNIRRETNRRAPEVRKEEEGR